MSRLMLSKDSQKSPRYCTTMYDPAGVGYSQLILRVVFGSLLRIDGRLLKRTVGAIGSQMALLLRNLHTDGCEGTIYTMVGPVR